MIVYDQEKNFLGITEASLSSYEKSKFVVQSIPYEHTSSYQQGSADGPSAILKASHYVEFYDEMLGIETYKRCGIATLAPMKFDGKADAEAVHYIEQETEKILKDHKTVVSFGAEHTVTLGLVKAHLKHYKQLSVLQIDAHADLRFSYHDNLYSHASVMARIHELDVPLTQVGIRALSQAEAELSMSSAKIHTFYAHDIRRSPNWMESVIHTLSDHVYLTFDADGFDPSVIPGTGTPEPGGLFWDETMDFLRLLSEKKKIVGFDIVECAPIAGQNISQYNLAKLAYRIMGFMVTGHP